MEYKKAFKTVKGRAAVIGVYDKILKEWKTQYEALSIDSNYGKTFVIKSGDSSLPPLILLHGTSSNSAMWLGEAASYSKHFCVYAIDIPGEPGKSEEKQYSLKDDIYFEWLNDIISILELKRVCIVGISLGAWLGVGYAVRYPETVEKLVLLCPSGIGAQKISFIFKTLPLMFLGNWGYNRIARIVNGSQKMPKEAEDYTQLIARNFNLRTEPVPIYSDEELRKIKIPVLLLAGENDVLLNSKETARRVTDNVPNAKVNLLSGYGHVLTGFHKEIIEFLIEF